MRRPCLSDWHMLRVDGFRSRRSLAVPDMTHPSAYKGAFNLRSFCVNGRRGQGPKDLRTYLYLEANGVRLSRLFNL